MFELNEEISFHWCLGLCGDKCTPSEAMGLWSVLLFYATILLVTLLHSVWQHQNGTAEALTTSTTNSSADQNNEWAMLLALVMYFFTFAAGCLVWALGGTPWVHPFQMWPVQFLGSALLGICLIVFVTVHVQLGQNWSPIPEQKAQHQLVTDGIFAQARHPMYAVFLWAAIGTLLATINWVITCSVSGIVLVTLSRIQQEERILTRVFGERYLDYQRTVSALGPPWRCLGFDRELHSHRHGDYHPID